MKKEVRLNYNLALYKRSDIDALLKLFETLIHATDGVLSGSMIQRNFYHRLNINIEKEILDAFGISSLEDTIHGIKSVVLYVDGLTLSRLRTISCIVLLYQNVSLMRVLISQYQ